MKIYVSHSRKFDFKNELYIPLRESKLNLEHEIVLPHEESDAPYNSKEKMRTFNLVLAEISYTGTGLGIELGWADAFEIPLIALCKKGFKISSSVKTLECPIVTYDNSQQMISRIEKAILDI